MCIATKAIFDEGKLEGKLEGKRQGRLEERNFLIEKLQLLGADRELIEALKAELGERETELIR